MTENNVEALRTAIDRVTDRPTSGFAYLLWDEGDPARLAETFTNGIPSSVELAANRGLNLSGRFNDRLGVGAPTALVLFTGYCSITGGHLRNRRGEVMGPCLVVLPTWDTKEEFDETYDMVAVTGNVLHGLNPILPLRPFMPPPLDDWATFNACLFV